MFVRVWGFRRLGLLGVSKTEGNKQVFETDVNEWGLHLPGLTVFGLVRAQFSPCLSLVFQMFDTF